MRRGPTESRLASFTRLREADTLENEIIVRRTKNA